jgi:hypothetical protein
MKRLGGLDSFEIQLLPKHTCRRLDMHVALHIAIHVLRQICGEISWAVSRVSVLVANLLTIDGICLNPDMRLSTKVEHNVFDLRSCSSSNRENSRLGSYIDKNSRSFREGCQVCEYSDEGRDRSR